MIEVNLAEQIANKWAEIRVHEKRQAQAIVNNDYTASAIEGMKIQHLLGVIEYLSQQLPKDDLT